MAEWSCDQRSPVQVPEGEAWALVGEQFGRIATWASQITASFLDRPPGKGALLAVAGLPAAHSRYDLDDPAMRPVRAIIELDAAPPRALPRLAGRARHAVPGRQHRRRGIVPGLTARTPGEILDLWFGPGPFRDRVANWPDVARPTL